VEHSLCDQSVGVRLHREKGICLQTTTYRVSKEKSSISMIPLQDQTMKAANEVKISTNINQDGTIGRGHVDETMNCSTMGMDEKMVVSKITADWLAEL
jgi:hypothetical protein